MRDIPGFVFDEATGRYFPAGSVSRRAKPVTAESHEDAVVVSPETLQHANVKEFASLTALRRGASPVQAQAFHLQMRRIVMHHIEWATPLAFFPDRQLCCFHEAQPGRIELLRFDATDLSAPPTQTPALCHDYGPAVFGCDGLFMWLLVLPEQSEQMDAMEREFYLSDLGADGLPGRHSMDGELKNYPYHQPFVRVNQRLLAYVINFNGCDVVGVVDLSVSRTEVLHIPDARHASITCLATAENDRCTADYIFVAVTGGVIHRYSLSDTVWEPSASYKITGSAAKRLFYLHSINSLLCLTFHEAFVRVCLDSATEQTLFSLRSLPFVCRGSFDDLIVEQSAGVLFLCYRGGRELLALDLKHLGTSSPFRYEFARPIRQLHAGSNVFRTGLVILH